MHSARNRGKQGKTEENRGKQRNTQKMEKCNHFCEANKGQIEKKSNKKEYKLVGFNELPSYMKHNEFILKYYRAEWPLKQAFFSLFQWHNETLNVWT